MSSSMPAGQTARQWAYRYYNRGFQVIPIPLGKKKPAGLGWPQARLSSIEDVARAFPADRSNIGLLTGASGIGDVDLDCEEARIAARYLLPQTGMSFGRHGAPISHHLYKIAGNGGAFVARQFTDPLHRPDPARPHEGMLVELRAGNLQTVVPPSIHPSGEQIVWFRFEEPALIDDAQLARYVARVAAAALVARSWPDGARNQASMALSGGLLRAGWPPDEVRNFVAAVAAGAGDEEAAARPVVVGYTEKRLAAGEPASGWPKLASYLGADGLVIVRKVREWLEINNGAYEEDVAGAGTTGARGVAQLYLLLKQLRLEIAARDNTEIKQDARTLIALCRRMDQLTRAGKVLEDGWLEMSFAWLAKKLGVTSPTVGRHIKKWARLKLYEYRSIEINLDRLPDGSGFADPTTGQVLPIPKYTKYFVRPLYPDLASMFTAIANYKPEPGEERNWGGNRRCKEHPNAPIRKVTHKKLVKSVEYRCAECGVVIWKAKPKSKDLGTSSELIQGEDLSRVAGSEFQDESPLTQEVGARLNFTPRGGRK